MVLWILALGIALGWVAEKISQPEALSAGQALLEHTGCGDLGLTSADGRFTVVEVECLGACGFATPIMINNDFSIIIMIVVLFVKSFSHCFVVEVRDEVCL